MKFRLVTTIVVIVLPALLYADSAIQTDWSAGPGISGPVFDWNDQFSTSYDMNWSGTAGQLRIDYYAYGHEIDGSSDGIQELCATDIDNDGDLDVVGAEYYAHNIAWWRNADGQGGSWTKESIGSCTYAASVYAADIDGDGDPDVICCSPDGDFISWWENDDSGDSWAEHYVDSFAGVRMVDAGDVNGDGDVDIIAAGYLADEIAWWENNGSGTVWTKHSVITAYGNASSVFTYDVNGDGYLDIVGSSLDNDNVSWFENTDGTGITWTQNIVDNSFDGAFGACACDMNDDTYTDILGAARIINEIVWWENDGTSTGWTKHVIDDDFAGPSEISTADIDDDGDPDVIGVANYGNSISWWENYDACTSFTEHIVTDSYDGARFAVAADISNDGNLEILSSAFTADDVNWWEVTDYNAYGELISSILEIELPVDNLIDWGNIIWNGSEPAGTVLAFQIRSSDNPGDMGAWSDTITVSGTSLTGIFGVDDFYIQYKAILETINSDSTSTLNDVNFSYTVLTGIESRSGDAVTEFNLYPLNPNPAFGSADVVFAVPENSNVSIGIYNLSGRLISTVADSEFSPGIHSILIDDIEPGIYFCRMEAEEFIDTQRMVMLR